MKKALTDFENGCTICLYGIQAKGRKISSYEKGTIHLLPVRTSFRRTIPIERRFRMKNWLCCLLIIWILLSTCACSEQLTSKNGPSDGFIPNITGSASNESNTAESHSRLTYEHALALHRQDPNAYRDPGDKQPETTEMIRLEDGQWYQSFVHTSFPCRYIFLNHAEFEMNADWDFVPIGSAENAFLYNAGVRYEDASGEASYIQRPIAIRGVLLEESNGYAYRLQLPDVLTVCLENLTGGCDFRETETVFIPEEAAAPLNGTKGEVCITGVVMQDENGILYLSSIALYPQSSISSEQDSTTLGTVQYALDGNDFFHDFAPA